MDGQMEMTLRELRHDLRGQANALILSAAAMHLAENKREAVEFIDGVIGAADKVLTLLDRLEAMPEHWTMEQPPDRPRNTPVNRSAFDQTNQSL
jgi:hypothetical protein